MSQAGQDMRGDLRAALDQLRLLLKRDPNLALQQAREILAVVPGQPDARLAIGLAHRALGDNVSALAELRALCADRPQDAHPQYELGRTLARMGDSEGALAALHRATELNLNHADAWRALGDELSANDDDTGAHAAYAQHLRAASNNPRLMAAASALCENALPQAETLLRDYLKEFPTDIAAIRMFAELAARLGRFSDAESLLRRALELAPDFNAARHNLAIVLYRQQRGEETLRIVNELLKAEPNDVRYRMIEAASLARTGDYSGAIKRYEKLLKIQPRLFKGWMSYGHALKTVGRFDDCIAAYRKSIQLAPYFGEAYWSLANLKTFQFSEVDIAAMQRALEKPDLRDEDRFHLHFALGKAFEDAGGFEESFRRYAEGNRIRRGMIGYDADEHDLHVARAKAFFTPSFFASREDAGSQARDPIFVVGLPRAGSTLIEQILASHSQVEGTMELPDIIALARRLRGDGGSYPESLADASGETLRALGEEYIRRTRPQRRTQRPLFVDKMPNNFMHVGFIHMILPNAKIIDARRHPMGCCFSAFKQHFARGQGFSYDLEELGRYYGGYVELMDHFDAVLPGRVHRVHYEAMVSDTEAEIRRLLAYCELPFEPGCLSFHETERAVRTASSEQVRRPIFSEGRDQWRNYAPWLQPLETSLGETLKKYPYP